VAKKKSILDFQKMKCEGEKIVALTAYDYPTAQFEEQAGIDMIEVGDSLGICTYGYMTGTAPVTVDQSVAHADAVRRGAPNTFLIGDMPFLSYQVSLEKAIGNAGKYYKEAGVDGVVVSGGRRITKVIRAIVDAGMIVCGDLGLPETEQDTVQHGSYRSQGRVADSARELINDARAIQEAGASLLILGPVPLEVAKFITEDLEIPVIGVGAGPYCDGQIIIINDLLGISKALLPKFVKPYANMAGEAVRAIANYVKDVRERKFPEEVHCHKMIEGEAEKLDELVKQK
jgi:3-methyl-2-oxobutanoate hydroxymethyltransferase